MTIVPEYSDKQGIKSPTPTVPLRKHAYHMNGEKSFLDHHEAPKHLYWIEEGNLYQAVPDCISSQVYTIAILVPQGTNFELPTVNAITKPQRRCVMHLSLT